MQKVMGSIIPGLIDDLGRECLVRMTYQDLPTASYVCKTWRDEVMGAEFGRFKKAAGLVRPMIILAQAQIDDPNQTSGQEGVKQNPSRPIYQLTLSDPATRSWTRLPGIPGMPDGLPMFSGLVGSGTDVLVIGGWDSATWRASSAVYIYSFLTGKWRKGADMPGVRRSFFGCAASDDDRTVLVAGGHDEDKNALSSAMLYDVDRDQWAQLPDLARARDECKVIFHRGNFHVISGYPTDMQGCFDGTAEVFNKFSWRWGPVIENFLEPRASSTSCVAGPDKKLYACVGRRGGDVAVQLGDRWHVIAKVPADVRSSKWMGSYGPDKLMVIGSPKFGEAQEGYMLDLKSYKWSKVDVPKEFSGHVQCGCVLEF